MSGLHQLVAEAQKEKPVSVATHEQAGKVTESDAQGHNFTVPAPLPQSNAELVKAIYGAFGEMPKGTHAWHAGFPGNHKEAGGAEWKGNSFNPSKPVGLDGGDLNRYISLNVYKPDDKGQGRRETNFVHSVGVMLDDVGTKAKTPTLLPSMVVETSPDNFQWTYLFDQRVSDIGLLKGINNALVKHGYCDPGATSPTTRYQRLPFAVNCKTGVAIPCKLTSFNPERRYTPQQLIDGLGLNVGAAGGARFRPIPDAREPRRVNANADVLNALGQQAESLADAELVANTCSMMGCFRETGDPDKASGDALWRLAAGVHHHCIGGEGVFHVWSGKDARYDRAKAQQKFDGWKVEAPPRCATIEGAGWAGCKTCAHRERDSTPVMLGRVTNTPHKDDPNKTLALERAAESGALRPIVDQDGVLNYVETYTKDGRVCRQVIKGGTEAASDLILTVASAGGGKAPSLQAIAVFEAKLRTTAKREGTVTPLSIRVAQVGDTRFVDLGTGRIAQITPQGWSLTDESEHVPLFRRGVGAGELPDPVPFDGDSKAAFAACIRHYSEMFQTPLEQAVVRTAVALDRLDPETTHPVCEYVGPAGSGKSTAAEHDIGLIDPPSKKGMRTCGLKTEDIAAASQQQYVLAFDNASRFDKTTSDTLCISSTGGTLVVRKFHEQSQTAALHLLRPPVVTAVNPVCTQPDLQTRTLRFEFRPNQTGEILGEDEIRAMTAVRLPALLGALYTLKAGTLRVLPEVRQRKGWSHRLITFDQTGEAMLCAAGYQPGAFIKIIGAMRESMARRSASGDVFLLKVCAALSVVCKWAMDDTEPTARQVLTRPREAAVFETTSGLGAVMRPGVLLSLMPRPDPWDRDSPIPKTVRALMDALRRVQPTLRAMGVAYSEATYGTRALLRFDWQPSDLDGLEGGA